MQVTKKRSPLNRKVPKQRSQVMAPRMTKPKVGGQRWRAIADTSNPWTPMTP